MVDNQELEQKIFHLFFANKISEDQMRWLNENIDTICCEHSQKSGFIYVGVCPLHGWRRCDHV
jgi:hypothetical protein